MYLPENLRYLCSFYPSISYVCRKVGINRQQFNKYLSGRIKPSIYILMRTCDFFGVDIEELFLAPSKLKATLGARARGSGRDGDAGADRAKSFALSKIGAAFGGDPVGQRYLEEIRRLLLPLQLLLRRFWSRDPVGVSTASTTVSTSRASWNGSSTSRTQRDA